MRVPGHHTIASIILIGFALGGCVEVSKEPYKAYEGAPAGVESVAAVLCKGCFVYSIDDKVLSPGLGPRYREAHLLPGKHAITVYTYYEDTGDVVLSGQFDFEAARHMWSRKSRASTAIGLKSNSG